MQLQILSSDEKLEKLFHRFRRAKSSQNSDLNDGNDATRMGVRMHFVILLHITLKIDFINLRYLDPKGFDAKANFRLLSNCEIRLLTKEIGA